MFNGRFAIEKTLIDGIWEVFGIFPELSGSVENVWRADKHFLAVFQVVSYDSSPNWVNHTGSQVASMRVTYDRFLSKP
jgi:hypothetical protein